MRVRGLIICLALVVSIVTSAVADAAAVRGVVVDPSGARIAGAQITMRDGTGQVVRTLTADANGTFSVDGLLPGTYEVRAESALFEEAVVTVVIDESDSLHELRLPMTIFRLNANVVVTATRVAAEVEKTPLSATVVTPKDITARPVQNLDQQLTLTEGTYVQRRQGFSGTDTNVYVRGMSGNARTLVLVDGQPINDAYASSVNWTGIPTNQIDSIEVVRGPFSSLYGGNALGGVINIRTRPIQQRALDGSVEYGTYDTYRAAAQYADRFRGRLGLLVGVERFETGGYSARELTATPGTGSGTFVTGVIPSQTSTGSRTAIIGESGRNELDRYAVRVKGELLTSDSSVVSLQYLRGNYHYRTDGYTSYLRSADGNVIENGAVTYDDAGTIRRLSVSPSTFLRSAPGGQDANFYSGSFQKALGAGTFQADAGVNDIPLFYFTQVGTTATRTSGPGTLSEGKRRTSHANLQYSRLVRQHSFTMGAETRHEMAESVRFALGNWTNTDSRVAQTSLAGGSSFSQSGYIQDQIAASNDVTVVFGARYDFWRGYDGKSDSFNVLGARTDYPSSVRNQFSGKAALGYALPDGWNLRASVGNSFRNANVFELFGTDVTSSGLIFAGNAALLPETLVSWETGLRKRFGGWTSVDAAYFENRIKDLIYRQTDLSRDPTGAFRINTNAGKGRTRGLELAVRQRLVTGLELRGTYTYTDAIITSNPGNPAIVGRRVTSIPDHMFSAQVLGSIERWTGSLAGHYVGTLFSTDTNTDVVREVPGTYSSYWAWDAAVSFSLTPRIEPFVSSENLLNNHYYVFYRSPGRTVIGGVRVRM